MGSLKINKLKLENVKTIKMGKDFRFFFLSLLLFLLSLSLSLSLSLFFLIDIYVLSHQEFQDEQTEQGPESLRKISPKHSKQVKTHTS